MDLSLEGTIKFVEQVRKHPVIYDRNKQHSDDPGAFQAAWKDVISQTGGTLQECKHRWRSLRCSYSKYLKNIIVRMQPYGIEPHLGFLAPIVRPTAEEGQQLEDRFDFNLKLVNHVRKRPCLYNGTQVHARPALWEEIAQRLQLDFPEGAITAERCQLRWKAIRLAYNTYLKRGYRFRPWGIEEHIGFVAPYVQFHQLPEQPELIGTFKSDKKLIELVKINPCLYDGSEPAQIDIWRDVADGMGDAANPHKYQKRWLKLRSAFQRHLVDGLVMYPRGIEQLMGFLEPYLDTEGEEATAATTTTLKIRRPRLLAPHIPYDTADRDVQFVMELADTMKMMNGSQKRQFRMGAVRLVREILDG